MVEMTEDKWITEFVKEHNKIDIIPIASDWFKERNDPVEHLLRWFYDNHRYVYVFPLPAPKAKLEMFEDFNAFPAARIVYFWQPVLPIIDLPWFNNAIPINLHEYMLKNMGKNTTVLDSYPEEGRKSIKVVTFFSKEDAWKGLFTACRELYQEKGQNFLRE